MNMSPVSDPLPVTINAADFESDSSGDKKRMCGATASSTALLPLLGLAAVILLGGIAPRN